MFTNKEQLCQSFRQLATEQKFIANPPSPPPLPKAFRVKGFQHVQSCKIQDGCKLPAGCLPDSSIHCNFLNVLQSTPSAQQSTVNIPEAISNVHVVKSSKLSAQTTAVELARLSAHIVLRVTETVVPVLLCTKYEPLVKISQAVGCGLPTGCSATHAVEHTSISKWVTVVRDVSFPILSESMPVYTYRIMRAIANSIKIKGSFSLSK